MKEIHRIYWRLTFTMFVFMSFQSSGQTIPDPILVEQIAKIKAIDNHSHVLPATANQGTEEEPADLLGKPRFHKPVNTRFDNLHWIGAWHDLYGYECNDMEKEHLGLLFKQKQRIKREQGENYPTWVLDKLGIETALVNCDELGLGQTPPRFYWVPYADAFLQPLLFSDIRDRTNDIEPAATLEEYTKTVVIPAIGSFKQEGAIAIKFITAYKRPLNFEKVSSVEAASVYERLLQEKGVSISEQRKLEDYLFRYITQEAGRLDLKVHIHTGAGGDPHFNLSGSNPMLLESVFNDPDQRNTNFVIIHGGWPFEKEAGVMLLKPNVYVDFSAQTFLRSTHALSRTIRAWLEWYPEKVLFGTDALTPKSPLINWEEYAWLSTRTARNALAIALTEMMSDGQISRNRAFELAEMVLRTNAIKLYHLSIYHAAEAGDLAKVKAFIHEGVDVNMKVDGFTPLHCAARYGHKEVAELLIAKGADINAKDTLGWTPIDLAINERQNQMAELLVSKGCEVSLHTAAYMGDLQRVEKFIDEGADVDAYDQKGQTALHYAAKTGQITVAKLLIANGADVNAGEDWTPLQAAAYYSKEMVKLLLAKGADINTGKWPALHSALDAQRFDIVELLLAEGADANIRDSEGRTPLHIAASYAASGNPKIVEVLISNGADIDAKDNVGGTALSYAMSTAIWKGYITEIVEILRKHGATE